MKIKPARRINGTIRLPGDKSISHRAALIAAMAEGVSPIRNFSTSRDCASTISCLAQLGVSIERDGSELIVEGVGRAGFQRPSQPLDCGNSASTMRMLAGILAGQSFNSTLTGDASLQSRPMNRIIEPLGRMGAAVFSQGGRPPLEIMSDQQLSPIRYEMTIASAQVKSCVLLAGLHAEGRTEVVEAAGQTRDHTERMLKWFGVPVEINNSAGLVSCAVTGPADLKGRNLDVPGDFSAASFLIAAAAMLPDSELVIEGVGLNPTRTRFLSVLISFGAQIEVSETREDSNELIGTLRIRGSREFATAVSSNAIKGELTADLIDELPLLAVVGTQLPGGIVIRDAGELRFKETDRITAVVQNLRAMGAKVKEFEDGLTVEGPNQLHGAQLDSYDDHRVAMAFSVAALLGDGESEIAGSDCVSVSFPEFYECLESIVEH